MDDRPAEMYLSGIATGLAALVIGWFLMTVLSTNNDASADPARGLQGDTAARCSTAADTIARPMRRAAASMSQWEIHIGAMNKLVAGDITFRQATSFWNQTRLGADDRINEFERAIAHLQRRGVDCPSPAWLPSHASPQLRACARQVAADMHVLQEARTAINTWRQHVHAMNMRRMGRLSPSTAEQMWLAVWHRGQHQIEAYRLDDAAAHRIHGCGSAALPSAP